MKIKRSVLVSLFLLSSSLCSFAQNFYVAEYGAGEIDAFSLAGDKTRNVGIPLPQGLAFDGSGNLYVASDTSVGAIYKIDNMGQVSLFTSGASLADPMGLAFDNLGNLYVATHLGGKILEIAPDGTQSTFATGAEYYGLAFSAFDGNLYATAGNAIYQFTLQGTRTLVTDIPGAGPIAIDGLGNLYIEGDVPTIYRVTPQGVTVPFATNARAAGLAIDGSGNVYASDGFAGTVDKYDPLGVGTTFLTGFNEPHFLAVGPPVPEPSTELLFSSGILFYFVAHSLRANKRRKLNPL